MSTTQKTAALSTGAVKAAPKVAEPSKKGCCSWEKKPDSEAPAKAAESSTSDSKKGWCACGTSKPATAARRLEETSKEGDSFCSKLCGKKSEAQSAETKSKKGCCGSEKAEPDSPPATFSPPKRIRRLAAIPFAGQEWTQEAMRGLPRRRLPAAVLKEPEAEQKGLCHGCCKTKSADPVAASKRRLADETSEKEVFCKGCCGGKKEPAARRRLNDTQQGIIDSCFKSCCSCCATGGKKSRRLTAQEVLDERAIPESYQPRRLVATDLPLLAHGTAQIGHEKDRTNFALNLGMLSGAFLCAACVVKRYYDSLKKKAVRKVAELTELVIHQ